MRKLLCFLLLGLAPMVAIAGDHSGNSHEGKALVFSSGPQQVHLLELYTSEGCSSCPPAEAWFARLLDDPRLWRELVPVTFHVDYWNYLGWDDPLSARAHSERQRRYRREGAANAVYTPGFIHDGREWRGWFTGSPLPGGSSTAPGELRVRIDGQELTAQYTTKDAPVPMELQVALLGFDITTEVRSGENRGRALTHQFSVLGHSAGASTDQRWQMALPEAAVDAPRRAIAVWVTRAGSQQPLQATGGWLP